MPSFPTEREMCSWIEDVVARGVRRPGYEADRWTEEWIHAAFVDLGLDHVRYEPVECTYWRDTNARLDLHARDDAATVTCSAVPLSEPTTVEAPLARLERGTPELVRDRIAVYDVTMMTFPERFPVSARPTDSAEPGSPAAGGWAYDPNDTFEGRLHVLPFAPEIHDTMQPAIDAGAVGFVGVLQGYPGDCRYYVPYDGRARPIPGVYIAEADADRVYEAAANNALASITVDATRDRTTTRNVVGELPGVDDEWVVVGTHHDAPWASAVEDGTGLALVRAQAQAWASVAANERPHRLVFVATAAHMADGAGTRAFIAQHRDALDDIVLEVHLEHAALDATGAGPPVDGMPVTPRWWFTSEIPPLEQIVWDAIRTHDLDRSLLMTPTALGPRPTTDGGFFHEVGVPLVNHLAAPWYLFDPADTIDKVDRRTLVALTRATFDIVAATAGTSASKMRAAHR